MSEIMSDIDAHLPESMFTVCLQRLSETPFTETVHLKVPKHEIFDGGFFASKEPIWSPDS